MPSFYSLILQTCLFTQGWNTSRRVFVADDLHHQCFFQTEFCFWSLNINGQRVFIANLIDVPLGSFTLFEFSRVSIVTILKVSTCSKTTKFFCQDFALPYKNASKNAIVWFPSCEIPSTDIALACDRTQRSFIFRLSSELLISLILVFMSYSELS